MGAADPLAREIDAPPRVQATPLARRALTTIVLAPALLWLAGWGPGWVFAGLVILVGAIGQWEFTRMFRRAGIPVLAGLGLAGGIVVTASFALPDGAPLGLTAVVLTVLAAGLGWRPAGGPRWDAIAVTALGVFYVNWLLGHALWLRGLPGGGVWVVLLLLVTWAGETAAYLVGSSLGRHRLAPAISPGKTVEGGLAQLLVSPVAAVLVQAWLLPDRSAVEAVGLGLLLGVTGQAGDLVESVFKRSAGAKDAGALMPGHGGILDRVDGLLFNTPVLFYYASYARGAA
jgi:phosphatidate cytidylyltransferase